MRTVTIQDVSPLVVTGEINVSGEYDGFNSGARVLLAVMGNSDLSVACLSMASKRPAVGFVKPIAANSLQPNTAYVATVTVADDEGSASDSYSFTTLP